MTNPYKNYAIWQRARIEAMDRFDWNCAMCGKEARCVHHLDGTKSNHSIDNLISLCQSCHLGSFHLTGRNGGRKKSATPTKMYSFRIYKDYLEKIKIMAIEKRMSASQIMNQALAEFISGE